MKKSNEVEKIVLDEIEEEYLDIYHKYFVLRWDWSEIMKYHKCSKSKIQNAIKWVIDNKMQFPSINLIAGAIDAVTTRLRKNRELYDNEVARQRSRDNGFVVALSREIREDEKVIFELQKLITPEEDDNDSKLNAAQVLRLIKEASKSSDSK